MTGSEIKTAIEDRLSLGFTELEVVADPHEDYRGGSDGYVALVVELGRRFPIAHGASRSQYERVGTASLGIHVPRGLGSGALDEHADAIEELFLGKSDQSLHYRSVQRAPLSNGKYASAGIVVVWEVCSMHSRTSVDLPIEGARSMIEVFPSHTLGAAILPVAARFDGGLPVAADAGEVEFVVSWKDGDRLALTEGGFVDAPTHGLGAPGARYALSDGTGGVTSSMPTQGVLQRVLEVVSPDRYMVKIGEAHRR